MGEISMGLDWFICLQRAWRCDVYPILFDELRISVGTVGSRITFLAPVACVRLRQHLLSVFEAVHASTFEVDQMTPEPSKQLPESVPSFDGTVFLFSLSLSLSLSLSPS